jgi:hypothetical protein
MSASLFKTWNANTSALTAPMSGTATSATSGTVKTILQVKPGSKIAVVEWGYIITAVPGTPVQIELIETDVAATVTTGSIFSANNPGLTTSLATTGTSATGYNATSEGTITATRLLDQTEDQGTYFQKQFPLDREYEVLSGKYLRVRATPTSNASSTIMAYVVWVEG